jgi:hypothetical protein
MASGVSQNGWPASSNPTSVGIKAFSFPLRGQQRRIVVAEAVAPQFIEIIQWWDQNIEPVTQLGSWNYREIRGKEGTGKLSNHSSGTAVDINWDKHPLGAVGTIPPAQADALRRKVASLGLRWGGDYKRRKDEHHIEVAYSPIRQSAVLQALKVQAVVQDKTKKGKDAAGRAALRLYKQRRAIYTVTAVISAVLVVGLGSLLLHRRETQPPRGTK